MRTPNPPKPEGWLHHAHKQGPRWWRQLRLSFYRWREPIRANRHAYLCYRSVIATVGCLIILIGLMLVPLPGPGWLIVFAGIALISTEFHFAKRLLGFAVETLRKWTRWLMRQTVWVRVAVSAATCLFVIGVVYAMLLLTGLPGWVPAWLLPEWSGLRHA